LSPRKGPFIFRGPLWSVLRSGGTTVFETYHQSTNSVLANAEADESFSRYRLSYNEAFWKTQYARNGLSNDRGITLGYPLEQLLFLPVLARHDGFLIHACGAVIDGKAFVFAGHSGDGKTTLSRILAREGVELLSDERIAVRKENGTFMAYGTPWPGEGNVVSPAAHPLGAIVLLRKSDRHRFRKGLDNTLMAELLSRSIVPYYLSEETQRIVNLLPELARAVILGELEFSCSPGLLPVLSHLR
jgi:hypothetical protein